MKAALAHTLAIFGTIVLTHAAYSAWEYAQYAKSANLDLALPNDIILQTLISAIILCVGIVMNAGPFRPIQFSAWAGMKEAEGRPLYHLLESQPSFLDIAAKRKQVAAFREKTKAST